MLSYFINNTAKTYLNGLKISQNIEMSFSLNHFFISVAICTQVASEPSIQVKITVKDKVMQIEKARISDRCNFAVIDP